MSERSDVLAEIEKVFGLMQRTNGDAEGVAADKLGDMVEERLDPYRRASTLTKWCARMQCRILARDYCTQRDSKARAAEVRAAAMAAAVIDAYTNPALFELQPSYPTGDGSHYLPLAELADFEIEAYIDKLERETRTKSAHIAALQTYLADKRAAGYYAEDGLPVTSERRVYGTQPPLI